MKYMLYDRIDNVLIDEKDTIAEIKETCNFIDYPDEKERYFVYQLTHKVVMTVNLIELPLKKKGK